MTDAPKPSTRASAQITGRRTTPGAPFRRLAWALTAALVSAASGVVAADAPRSAFRPCIDPSNLPFANEKGEGFENRIADLFARKLGLPVQSYAFPQRMNFIRNTLRYRLPGEDFRCDIVMGIPASYDQAWPTAPYYHSTYALVYRKGHGLDQVTSGSDLLALPADVRSKLSIGIYDRSPAALWLVKHGMEAQTRPFPMMSPDPDWYAGQIIDKELAQGRIDAVIVWGPIAGYFAKRAKNADLVVIPLHSEPGIKFDYAIAMGVRRGDAEWRETVDKLITENRPAITAILREYGVPLVDERGDPIN